MQENREENGEEIYSFSPSVSSPACACIDMALGTKKRPDLDVSENNALFLTIASLVCAERIISLKEKPC